MRRLGLALALAVAVAGPAAAHRGHSGLTVVEITPATGAVSVSHRFAAHDVEPALVTVAPDAQPSLDDPQAVAALEDHLARRFRLSVDGVDVALTRTETRLAGDNVRIDFTGAREGETRVASVVVDLDFFPGVHDDQEQQVNVRIDGVTRTVVFRPGDQAKSVDFAN